MTSELLLSEGDDRRWGGPGRPVTLAGASLPSPSPGAPDGRRLAPLRRWPTMVATLVVVWLLAGAFVGSHHPTYTSTTTVFLRAVSGNALSASSAASSQQLTVAMETEARLVQSPAVAAIAQQVGREPLASGGSALTATVPANTQIVRIQFAAGSPAQARLGADAFATAFLQYRSEQGKDAERRQLHSLHLQSSRAQQQLRAAIQDANSAHPAAGASTRVQLYTSRLAAIGDSLSQIESGDINPGSVVMPASTPRATLTSNRWALMGGATAVGLALALAMALVRERFDDRLRAGRQPSVGGVCVWARIPRQDDTLLDDLDDGDPVREGFRAARAGVVKATSRPCVLTITRSPTLDAVMPTALDLGLSLRDAGLDVVLVDASFEPHALAGIAPSASGLSDHLTAGRSPQLGPKPWRGLRVLGPGVGLFASRDLLSNDRMSDLVGRLRSSADYVLLVAPAADTAEAVTLGGLSDATVLVACDGTTTHRQVRDLANRHGDFGSWLAGAIVVSRTSCHRWWRRRPPRTRGRR